MADKVQIGDCTLYLGDCRDILPTLRRVDACVEELEFVLGLDDEAEDDGA